MSLLLKNSLDAKQAYELATHLCGNENVRVRSKARKTNPMWLIDVPDGAHHLGRTLHDAAQNMIAHYHDTIWILVSPETTKMIEVILSTGETIKEIITRKFYKKSFNGFEIIEEPTLDVDFKVMRLTEWLAAGGLSGLLVASHDATAQDS